MLKENGEVRTTKEEEDVNIEQQLLEHISEHASSLGIASVDAGDGLVCNVMTGVGGPCWVGRAGCIGQRAWGWGCVLGEGGFSRGRERD